MKQVSSSSSSQQRGAVSLIVVIFTALLVTIITVGFVSLMVRSQQQATQSDLSQSAYDSALAGIEDAKRVLLLDKKCKETGDTSPLCTKISSILDADAASHTCADVNRILGDGSGETLVGQTDADKELLRQAYTCAKISLVTPDYRAKDLPDGQSHLIPLKVAPGSSFNTIEIEWFTQYDATVAAGDEEGSVPPALNLPEPSPDPLLPEPNGDIWTAQTPPLMRTQLLQVAGSFNLSQLNDAGGLGNSGSSTLFLYPNRNATSVSGFNDDSPLAAKEPRLVKCDESEFLKGGYACKISLTLPNPIGGDQNNRTAFLRLTPFYNTTSYRIVLKNNTSDVPFYGVQPEVDVTGRANDVFRRVKARVQLDAIYPYPESTVDLNGNLCKDFAVTSPLIPDGYDKVNQTERCNPRGSSD